YSELFPVLMLVTALVAVQALWRAHRLKITTYVLRAAVVVAACFVVLANVQIAKFVALFPIVTGIIVGWDVQWNLLDFWAFGMGTRQAGVEAAVPVMAPMAVRIAVTTQAALGRGRAGVMRGITRSARPFEAYRQLAEAVNRVAPDTVFLLAPPGQVWPRALYTYFLYPRRIMGDWRNVPYLD